MNEKKYKSPFQDRYAGACTRIWSDFTTRSLWRYHWVLTSLKLHELGLLPLESEAQVSRLRGLVNHTIVLDSYAPREYKSKVEEAERRLGHDVVAELEVFQDMWLSGNRVFATRVHAVQTSSNIKDMAHSAQSLASWYKIMEATLGLADDINCLMVGSDKSFHSVQGRTHLQPANITAIEYRFAVYLHRILGSLFRMRASWADYVQRRHPITMLGGPVGTYGNLAFCTVGPLRDENPAFFQPTFQTWSRELDLLVSGQMMELSSHLYKMGQDIRLMLSYGDLDFDREEEIQGSSSMPTKRNPIFAETACGLLRHIPALAREVWDYSSHSMLERTLDDSSVMRYALPEIFMAMETAIRKLRREISGISPGSKRKIDPTDTVASLLQSRLYSGVDGEPCWLSRQDLSGIDWRDEEQVKNLQKEHGITRPLTISMSSVVAPIRMVRKQMVQAQLPRLKEYPNIDDVKTLINEIGASHD